MVISSPAEMIQGVLVFADISGYTRFSRLHYTSLLHAEEIITELLESILQSAEFPLQVGQLEGDAILLYAEVPVGSEVEAARETARQVQRFFTAFDLRERNLIACDAGCACEACNQIGELRLKAVLHFGHFARNEFHGVLELRGEGVALVHNLLKIPILEREYILVTERFFSLSGDLETGALPETRELPLENETVRAHVYFPRLDLSAVPNPAGAGAAFSRRLNKYSFGRMLLNQPRGKFSHLPGERLNLILYLLEGIQSALNISRKTTQRIFRQISGIATIKQAMLILVEVKTTSPLSAVLTSQLLQAALSGARPPLILNKLEVEAGLLFALAENDRIVLANGLMRQARRIFRAFEQGCRQAAQTHPSLVEELRGARLRVIFHGGDVAFKRVREFDELAGLPVILIHRLLQSPASNDSALWMTDFFYELVKPESDQPVDSSILSLEGLEDVSVRILPLSGMV